MSGQRKWSFAKFQFPTKSKSHQQASSGNNLARTKTIHEKPGRQASEDERGRTGNTHPYGPGSSAPTTTYNPAVDSRTSLDPMDDEPAPAPAPTPVPTAAEPRRDSLADHPVSRAYEHLQHLPNAPHPATATAAADFASPDPSQTQAPNPTTTHPARKTSRLQEHDLSSTPVNSNSVNNDPQPPSYPPLQSPSSTFSNTNQRHPAPSASSQPGTNETEPETEALPPLPQNRKQSALAASAHRRASLAQQKDFHRASLAQEKVLRKASLAARRASRAEEKVARSQLRDERRASKAQGKAERKASVVAENEMNVAVQDQRDWEWHNSHCDCELFEPRTGGNCRWVRLTKKVEPGQGVWM